MPNVDDDIDTNPTSNPHLNDIIARQLTRRRALQMGGLAASAAFFAGRGSTAAGAAVVPPAAPAEPTVEPAAEAAGEEVAAVAAPLLGFASVPLNSDDAITVPPGYTARVLFAWGDPVGKGPAFKFDASQDAKTQAVQAGMHHDGIFYFPKSDREASTEGLLCINHEYVDQGLLYPDGMVTWTADKVRKAIAAHGVSVIEIEADDDEPWTVVKGSKRARRITGATPTKVVGPAAGSALLKTAADPKGVTVLGTLNNCGSGQTPWGTYVTCEENFNGYFAWDGVYTPSAAEARYGISKDGFGYRWHEHDPRFNVRLNPNEANRFGWAVEIDPYDAKSTPLKLTALGRFKHESVAFRLTADGRPVCYSGDDERNNYLYKFVGKHTVRQARKRKISPLAEGTLYVARFDAGPAAGDDMGVGEWLPLTTANPLLAGMTIDQILVNARVAADLVGATKLDRPEWVTVAPDGQAYVALTNNSRRGRTTTNPSENPNSVVDEANPRSATGAGNPYGHIVRWTENGDADATSFTWDIFVLAGDPANPAALNGYLPGGNVNGDMFGSADGIWADADGRIWLQTDISTSTLGAGAYVNITNNMMLAADPATKEIRRFLVGPKGCEVTGVCTTPDQRTMFVDIQHPGEPASELSDPANPQAVSNWPDFLPVGQGRPRSATVVITKDDGGIIGT